MSNQHRTAARTTTENQSDAETIEALTAEVELLREENQRIRTQFAQSQRTEYRRAALGIGVLGIVAAFGGLVFADTRAPLFALAGIGLFTAVLTYYLTPERFVAASVGERTYAARATLGAALVADLGLQDTRVYVPTSRAPDPAADAANVTLFVPQHMNYTIPDEDALSSVIVAPSDERARGVALPPTGAPLVRECEQTMVETFANTPESLAEQLTDALVDGFEFADETVIDHHSDDGQLTVGIRNSTFGAVDRFDHPIVSFLATGLAVGLETPITVDMIATDAERFDYLVTCSWDIESAVSPDTETDPDSEPVTDPQPDDA